MPVCASVGSGGRFRKVPEGSGRFREVPVCAGVVSGISSGKLCVLVRVVREGSGAC